MYRYFVLIWNPRDKPAAANARALCERMVLLPLGWARIFEAEGVCAFHAGLDEGASQTLLLEQGAGAVFGRIFNSNLDTTASAVRIEFDAAETAKIVQTGGRRLMQRYWGRYVALVQ